MKSNFKKIGDHIKLVDERNKGLQVKQLLGLSISKQFIPSVANIIGTDMENYKIIRKNQFACSTMQVRRDKKMPVALLQEVEAAIISQAYPIFEVKDDTELLPEYLMMWFTRSEFDREACFNAVGGVRGSLEWEDFCDMKLPIPSKIKQTEIVREYDVVQNRIILNGQLTQKLEEAAQAIYKQWFIDFDFPDENGQPYKSSGGEMILHQGMDREIPKGWRLESYKDVMKFKTGKLNSEDAVPDGEYPFFTCSNETFKTNTFSFNEEAVILAGNNASAVYPLKYFVGKFNAYQRTYVITSKCNSLSNKQIYFAVKSELENFKGVSSGTATKFLTMEILNSLPIIISDFKNYQKFEFIMNGIFKYLQHLQYSAACLTTLKETLLSKLASIEN